MLSVPAAHPRGLEPLTFGSEGYPTILPTINRLVTYNKQSIRQPLLGSTSVTQRVMPWHNLMWKLVRKSN